MKQFLKIYVDLDGVLADFDKAYDALIGGRDKRPAPHDDDAFWRPIIEAPNFWLNIEPMPYYHKLWSFLCAEFDHVAILSSPGTHDTERAKAHKRLWVRKVDLRKRAGLLQVL